MTNQVELVTQIVAAAGTAKSDFVEAIHVLIQEKDLEKARKLYEEGCKMFHTAHEMHLEILSMFANEEKVETDILLVHGECQLMSAEDFEIVAGQLLEYMTAEK